MAKIHQSKGDRLRFHRSAICHLSQLASCRTADRPATNVILLTSTRLTRKGTPPHLLNLVSVGSMSSYGLEPTPTAPRGHARDASLCPNKTTKRNESLLQQWWSSTVENAAWYGPQVYRAFPLQMCQTRLLRLILFSIRCWLGDAGLFAGLARPRSAALITLRSGICGVRHAHRDPL